MRLWTFLLLSILVVAAVNCAETKKSKQKANNEEKEVEDLDSKEFKDALEKVTSERKKQVSKKKDKAEKPDSNEVTTDEENTDSDDDSGTHAKGGWDVCGKDEACKCEGDTLNCDKESYDNGPFDSVNVYPDASHKETITRARFVDNSISKLVRKEILPHCASDLQELVLSKNHITKLTEDSIFQGFTKLAKLYLDNNRITNITQNSLKHLTKLHQLYLNENRITKLENSVFLELRNLKKLVLDGNKIELSMALFTGLNNLEELSLDNCNIKELDSDVFNNLNSLKYLSLRNNPIVEIPKAINSLRNLEILDISGTYIPEFHAKELNDDIFLKELRMEQMPYLYTIQECAFCGLERLESLYMGNNSKLHTIHLDAFGITTGDPNAVKSLKHLNIENCNLTNFPEQMINWEHLEEFAMNGNPIDCNCETMYLMANGFYANFNTTNSVANCATPPSVKGRPLPSVNPGDICDDYKGPEQFKRSAGRGFMFFALLLILCTASIGMFHLYSTGRLAVIWNNVRNRPNQFPAMSYANLNSNVDDNRALEADFQPRPEQV